MAATPSANKKNKKHGHKLSPAQRRREEEKQAERARAKNKRIKKEEKRKRTGKEIAIIVVSVIMVVSILLPSFSQIFTSGSSSSTQKDANGEKEPTSYDEATDYYQPKVDEQKAALDKNDNDQKAMLELANDYYNWASKANSYTSDDEDKENAVNDLFQQAIDEYTTYLDAVGNLNSSDAKTAALNRAMAYRSLDDTDQAIQLLQELGDQTNYAMAWADLGMIYDGQGNTQQALIAYEKAANSADMQTSNIRSYALQRLTPMRKSAQSDSGGPEALEEKLDISQGLSLSQDMSSTLPSKLAFSVYVPPALEDDSSSSTTSTTTS